MSRVDMKVQTNLLKEAGAYFKDLKSLSQTTPESTKEPIVLTQEHIYEWLEIFYEDRIRMDTCNQASVRM
ncbi:MAG: hypothetical protein JXQ67_01170 [Campylobacterales bacterium]|nr:hypothetical protein [Campylobacterales bacterium]